MKYVRRWKCEICGGAVIVDTTAQTITCDCGRFHTEIENEKDFEEKYELLCL